MADSLNAHNYDNKLEEISLSLIEEDIPGASLNGNDP